MSRDLQPSTAAVTDVHVEAFAQLLEQNAATMPLLMLLDAPDSEARDIVPVSEADPAMTARLLTLANSAFSGVRAQATNPSAAAMVVRSNVVRALAAAGSLGIQSNNSNVPPRLFNHALNSAAAPASLRGMPAFTRVRRYCTTSAEHYSFSAAGEK